MINLRVKEQCLKLIDWVTALLESDALLSWSRCNAYSTSGRNQISSHYFSSYKKRNQFWSCHKKRIKELYFFMKQCFEMRGIWFLNENKGIKHRLNQAREAFLASCKKRLIIIFNKITISLEIPHSNVWCRKIFIVRVGMKIVKIFEI